MPRRGEDGLVLGEGLRALQHAAVPDVVPGHLYPAGHAVDEAGGLVELVGGHVCCWPGAMWRMVVSSLQDGENELAGW